MHLNELKSKNPSDLLSYAESLDVENASNLRKQDMMFACLKSWPIMMYQYMEKVY